MGSSQLEAIVDAGPLIHLTEIGHPDIFTIFDRIHIPDAVWAETVDLGRVEAHQVHRLKNTVRHVLLQSAVTSFIAKNNLNHLHTGECECLYLCEQIGVYTLGTDDLSAREAAKRLHIQPIGSLGMIVKAYKLGYISIATAEQCIQELYRTSTLFVTKVIVTQAIEQLYQLDKSRLNDNPK